MGPQFALVAIATLTLAGCTTPAATTVMPLEQGRRLSEKYSSELIAQYLGETQLTPYMYDTDCREETGISQRQCEAYVARMSQLAATITENVRRELTPQLSVKVEALATAISRLSETDRAKLRMNHDGSGRFEALSAEGVAIVSPAFGDLMDAVLQAAEHRHELISDQVTVVLNELMRDPSFSERRRS